MGTKNALTEKVYSGKDIMRIAYPILISLLMEHGFIDQALLNNMAQVDIIHGIGTGVIREGVTKYLRRNKHVKSFEYAPQNAGGSGATIVTFKG